jgi:hypothetical protein
VAAAVAPAGLIAEPGAALAGWGGSLAIAGATSDPLPLVASAAIIGLADLVEDAPPDSGRGRAANRAAAAAEAFATGALALADCDAGVAAGDAGAAACDAGANAADAGTATLDVVLDAIVDVALEAVLEIALKVVFEELGGAVGTAGVDAVVASVGLVFDAPAPPNAR